MAQQVLRIEGLPQGALDAAGAFHAQWAPKVRELLATSDLVLVFAASAYDHRAWRLAALQDLARAAAPRRVNGIAGGDRRAIAEAIGWLATAPGITGQLLAVG